MTPVWQQAWTLLAVAKWGDFCLPGLDVCVEDTLWAVLLIFMFIFHFHAKLPSEPGLLCTEQSPLIVSLLFWGNS